MHAKSTSGPKPTRSQWWWRWAIWSALLIGTSTAITAAVLKPGLWKTPLHIRTTVTEASARQVLYETVGKVLVHGEHDLCTSLGTHPASTCTTSLTRAGKPPGRAPGVRCVTQLQDGPFAGGIVLTLRGRTDLGEAYTTDFVVVDRGPGPQAIDPVYWSNLHLVETAGSGPQPHIKTTSWRYDGESTRCQ